MKIVIIGGGNMGITYAKAFIKSHIISPEELTILEKDTNDMISKLEANKLGKISTQPSIVKDADLLVLAVKPQDANLLFNQIIKYIHENQIILSIMAGITIDSLVKNLKVKKVIRAMPNLPAQIGLGMTAFTSTEEVSKIEQQWIQNLLQTTGKTINVSSEKLIDAVTAISGSGPAYIYYFMDSMIHAAVEMGITNSTAEMLVQQTFSGALSLFQQNDYNCNQWIGKVASKGGTTEAAIDLFNQYHLNQIIANGAKAALNRAEELGR